MSELRSALRALGATPVVTLVVILSLALAIGANTAMFSLVDSLLLRVLPVERAERLVSVEPSDRGGTWSYAGWRQVYARKDTLFDGALAFRTTRFNLSPRGQAEHVDGLMASGGYFDLLGVKPMIGRTFTEDDDLDGGGRDGAVAVISYAFWQRRYNGAADAVGRTMIVDRVPFTIVGVTPPGFSGVEVGRTFDVAIPIGTDRLINGASSAIDRFGTSWLRLLARLKEAQTLAEAEQAFRGVQPQIREATRDPNASVPTAGGAAAIAAMRDSHLSRPFRLTSAALGTSAMRGTYRQPVLVAMTVVALVLLIACANIANLFLARAAARRHELSVRVALGAPRWRLARQLIVEILLMAGAGALAGLAIAIWTSRLLVRQLSTQMNTVFLDVRLDWRLLAFTVAIAFATALVAGVAPALRASRADPIDAIRERGRGVTGDRRFGLSSALVIGQVALSLVLVAGAGLFMRTFTTLATLDTGFDRDPVLVVAFDARSSNVEPARWAGLFDRVTNEVRDIPGVSHAALSAFAPASGFVTDFGVEVEHGRKPTDFDARVVGQLPRDASYSLPITPEFFATYGTRIVDGRDFTMHDGPEAPHVAIVNETFVRRLLVPGRRAVGQRFRSAFTRPGRPNPWMEVVGVVNDTTYRRLRDELQPTFYAPISQWVDDGTTRAFPADVRLSVRAAGGRSGAAARGAAAQLARGVAEAIGRVDPAISITFTPLARQIDDTLVRERILAMLSAFFGGLALVLSGLGLYGLMAYSVSRRRHEIGIRMALGAEARAVVRMVLHRVLLLIVSGVTAGVAATMWLSRYVETLLYGVTREDPGTLAVAALVLVTVGVAAGWIPARRASRIDPARVLHGE
jgi:putative ABC transport system permease protein